MIILPKRYIYPKEDIDGMPINGQTLYRVVKQHVEDRQGTKFIIYDKLQRFEAKKK